MRQLTRDPAQPLVTLLDGPARVELSGATAANWAAKTANLLTTALGAPERVGLLLPLHWQVVTLLQGTGLTGATAVVTRTPADLEGCAVAFVAPEHAEAALDAGVDEVLAVSASPLGGRLGDLPPMVLDAGAELPVHGDHWGGPLAQGAVELDGHEVRVPHLDLGTADRVLSVLPPAEGLLLALLGPLRAGAALVLCPSGVPGTVGAVASEGVTATVGVDLPGTRRLD